MPTWKRSSPQPSPAPWPRSGKNARSWPTLQRPSPSTRPLSWNWAKAQLIGRWRCKSATVHMHKPGPLQPSDSFHVRAAQGWLELGNHLEANEELEEITPVQKAHPTVLFVRWDIYAMAKKWDYAAMLAD